MASTTNITFDSAKYDKLTADLAALEKAILQEATKYGMPIDDSFAPFPGTPQWVLAGLQDKSKALGASIETHCKNLEQQLELFVAALRDARDIFEETNDLAQYSVTDFLADYPDLNPSSGA